MATSKLRWAVPRWSYVPRLWRELNRIVNLQSMIRICSVSILGCLALVGALKIAIPNLALGNLWPIVFALPGIVLAVIAEFTLLTLIPPFVTIRKDKIQYVHGQNGFQINANQIKAIQLTVFSDTRIRLKIRYAHHRKSRILRFGVSPQIVLGSLSNSLPLLPKIVDARNRSIRPQDRLD